MTLLNITGKQMNSQERRKTFSRKDQNPDELIRVIARWFFEFIGIRAIPLNPLVPDSIAL